MESIDSLNRQLIDLYGIDTITGQAIWRIVWSDDQFEKRYATYTDFTPNGLFIREVTELREVPKYRQWVHHKHILERLVLIPETNMIELPGQRVSYELLYTFQDKDSNPLPPRIDVCQILIDTVYAAQGKGNLAKYKEGSEEVLQKRKQNIQEIYEYLCADESPIGDALAVHSGISVPSNYNKEK